MKQLKVLYFMLGLLAFSVKPALADVNVSVTFFQSDLSITPITLQGQNYDFVNLKGCSYLGAPGEPMLPVKTVYVSIPANQDPNGLIVGVPDTVSQTISNKIYPAQYPIAADGVAKNVAFVAPSAVYTIDANYPGNYAEVVHSGNLGGYKIVAINVYPLQYNPAKNSMALVTSVSLTLTTKSASVAPLAYNTRTEFQDKIYRKMVSALVTNPSVIPVSKVKKSSSDIMKPLKLTQLPSQESDEVPYIIITESPFDTVFQRLADWKTKRGLPTIVKKVSWINQNYFGVDLQDKIRNFIRDCYSNWGTVYVLLGGGPEIVPCRYTRNFCRGYAASDAKLYTENVPSDMYYSDLDGTWNTDGDNYFGEGPVIVTEEPLVIDYNDIVDMYPEVFVGRASVDSVKHAQTFVHKTMTYETTQLAATTDYSQKLCFLAGLMDVTVKSIDTTITPHDTTWASTPTDTTKNSIISQYLPANIIVDPLYNRCDSATGIITRNLDKQSAWQALNNGLYNIVNQLDHGGWFLTCVGQEPGQTQNRFYMHEVDTMRNNDSLFIWLAFMNCETNYFDRDCFAEHAINCATGGPVKNNC